MASQWPPKKNTAFTLNFTLFKNDGTVIANPGTITKKISKDEAAVADISASITEEDTTYGQCSVVLSSDEMNADRVWIYIKDDTTGCVPFVTTLYTAANLMDDIKTDTAAILTDTGTTLDGKIDTIDTVVDAIKVKTDYLPSAAPLDAAGIRTAVGMATNNLDTQLAPLASLSIKKNTALANFTFVMRDATTKSPTAGATVTCTRKIDAGSFGAGTLANVAEIANGLYKVDFGAGDLNGSVVTLRCVASGCDDTFVTIIPTV